MCIGSPSFSVWSLRAQRSPNHQSEPLCFFVFDYHTSDEHRIYFNQLELEFLLGIFEAATLFIHSTSQLDVWRASTKVSLFVPKVPPKKKQPPKPWNPKSYSPIFFFGQPPAPSFPLFFFKGPPLYFGRRRIFCLKNKKPFAEVFLFAPKVRNNLFIFGGEVFGLCQEEKSLEVGTWKGRLEELGTRGSGWKSQVEVTMMALVGGGGVFRLLVFFLLGTMGSRDIQ